MLGKLGDKIEQLQNDIENKIFGPILGTVRLLRATAGRHRRRRRAQRAAPVCACAAAASAAPACHPRMAQHAGSYASPVHCAHLTTAKLHPQLPPAFTNVSIFKGDWDMPGLGALADQVEGALVS